MKLVCILVICLAEFVRPCDGWLPFHTHVPSFVISHAPTTCGMSNDYVELKQSNDTNVVEEFDEKFAQTASISSLKMIEPSELMENIFFLQSLSAITCRGEQANEQQRNAARMVVNKIETLNPTIQPMENDDLLQGTWELTFTDTKQLFRCSPFFMAGRAVCQTKEQLEHYNWFCNMHRKALSISQIGSIRQVIGQGQLTNEFEVQAGAIPFIGDFTPFKYSGGLPITIDGAIVSTASLTPLNATAYNLFMDTVQIKGSNIPGLRQVLDNGLQLQSRMLGDFLESNLDQYSNPRPVVRVTYLSEQLRICRDMDDNIFVFVKTSNSTTPKDYSDIDSDLGISHLLEGFNNAITKIGV